MWITTARPENGPTSYPTRRSSPPWAAVASSSGAARSGGLATRLVGFAVTYGCRAAFKAGQGLDVDGMRDLVARLLTATLPAHDVHGRPTVVQLPKDELERRFGRT